MSQVVAVQADDPVVTFFAVAGYQLSETWQDKRAISYTFTREAKSLWVRWLRSEDKVTAAQLEQFVQSVEQQSDDHLSACFIAADFSKAALTQAERDASEQLLLLRWHKHKLTPVYPYHQTVADSFQAKASSAEPLYIGVFTAKGGVGKTTIAAHLAGAFALMGQSVVLLDLDPDRNLRKLFADDNTSQDDVAMMQVPATRKGEAAATIRVLAPEQWRARKFPDVNIVIADCSPVLSENPAKLIKRFDVCVMPTTLNPLGIAKHADVMTRTFAHIRTLNATARLMAVINNYDASADAQKRNAVLFAYLQSSLAAYFEADGRAMLIHPEEAKIRHSNSLLYWGYHIIEGSSPQLAFKETAGRSYPRSDFLQLAEVVEREALPNIVAVA
jgi:chromosome partitioning protein